jgi:hypothetical protein
MGFLSLLWSRSSNLFWFILFTLALESNAGDNHINVSAEQIALPKKANLKRRKSWERQKRR